MMRRSLLLVLLMAGLLPAIVRGDGSSASLIDFELKSLAGPEVHSLERYAGKPIVMLFFQPDCNWCFRQVQTLNELGRSCEFSAILVGVRGDRRALRQELRRLKPDFPAYQASPKLLDAVGDVETTPLTLLGNANGEFVDWTRGYIPEERFTELLSAAGQLECPTESD